MHVAKIVEVTDPLYDLAEMNEPRVGSVETKRLIIGSDVEIAGRVREDLERAFGEVVFTEGNFWRYGTSHWQAIPSHELRCAIHGYDGAEFTTASGTGATVKLNKSRIDSTLNEMSALLTRPDFFTNREVGINCASGFICIDADGSPNLKEHNPEYRCRHTLPGHFDKNALEMPPKGSLLHSLLEGVFRGDADAAEKIDLLAEVIGVAALGAATKLSQPRAVILKGETAENGKSQILNLARSLLPADAVSTVTAARMGDERHIVGLIGKLLNASDELSSADDIASDTFKAIITGDPVQGRDVYKSRIEFRSMAQHLFATNNLPAFSGGMDRGVQRRLQVITFNRVIPKEERIEDIGSKVGKEEADLLLAWAVAGASRLMKQKYFTIPFSSKSAMIDWLFGADPVLAWASECVKILPLTDTSARIRTREAYRLFYDWAMLEGFRKEKLPSINGFVQRIQANVKGIEYRRISEGRFFYGMVVMTAHTSAAAGNLM